jgi:hypothetical protein
MRNWIHNSLNFRTGSSDNIDMENVDLIQQIHRRASIKYMVALLLVAIMAVTSFTIARQIIVSHRSKGSLINISGRQRMLSQRIGLYVSLAMTEKDLNQRYILLESVNKHVDTLESSHEKLIYRPETIADKGFLSSDYHLSPELIDIYFGPQYAVDKKMREFIFSARKVTEGLEASETLPHVKIEYDKLMALGSDELLAGLEKIVTQHELENDKDIFLLERVEAGVLVLTISLLLFELFYIYIPMNGSLNSILRILALLKKDLRYDKH